MNNQAFSQQYGRPIRYDRLDENYQTLFSFHPGSAEMPSASRGFTPELVDQLLNKGMSFAPVILHTGVSSIEDDESPYPEFMQLDLITESIINAAKRRGPGVIAVGTSAVRSVESVALSGVVSPYKSFTDLYIHCDDELKVIDSMLTGFHEPKASHLHMLTALAGNEHIEKAYRTAIDHRYYWHEFGDLHLILP